MRSIDLNCDLGEGFPGDAELMAVVTSANIACGCHAGDDATMAVTIRLAVEHDVAVGAHPGYADRENFGRVPIDLNADEITALVTEQVCRLRSIANSEGIGLSHVKPHGALYNQASVDVRIASAIVRAIKDVDDSLVLFGLAGSLLVREGLKAGLRVVEEAFADRRYTSEGTLAPRSIKGAVIEDPLSAAGQALKIARSEPIGSIEGGTVRIEAGTICLHGDGKNAVETARIIRQYLEAHDIEVKRYDR